MSAATKTITTSIIGNAEHVLVPRLTTAASSEVLADGRLRFSGPQASLTLPLLPAGLAAVLGGLATNNLPLTELFDRAIETDGPSAVGLLHVHLARFSTQGLLTHQLVIDGEEIASIEPTGMSYRFLVQPIRSDARVRLSRFSFIRREDDHLAIESGLSAALIHIRKPALMTLLGMLASETTPEDLRDSVAPLGISDDGVAALLLMLRNAGHLDTDTESDDRKLWNPHDLLFHMSSRFGRMGGNFGGNFRHVGEIEPAPAVRPLPTGKSIPLPVPVLEELMATDAPFQRVAEERESRYSYGSPITLDDIGEFLYRAARVRWQGSMQVESLVNGNTGTMELSSRPIPGGGKGYELELYLTMAKCDGITAGIYHYDPAGHQLTFLREMDSVTEQLLAFASMASPGIQPQVLVTMAARFRRMMWKYDRLAYAATLKHVGVMMQQMYLAATAMQLSASAQGSGNVEVFAAATGNDPLVESSVGEFILGSSPGGARLHRPTMMYREGAGAS